MYTFTFPIKTVPKGRPRFSRNGHAFTPSTTREFEASLKRLANAQMAGKSLLNGQLGAFAGIYIAQPKKTKLSAPKPDLDNMVKGILDSFNQVIYNDDSQIQYLVCEKKWWDKDQIIFAVWELDEEK